VTRREVALPFDLHIEKALPYCIFVYEQASRSEEKPALAWPA